MLIRDGYEGVEHDPALPFPPAEYQRREQAVRTQMEKTGIDTLLLSDAANVCYLTGYDTAMPSGYAILVFPREGAATLHCSELEVTCMRYTGSVETIAAYSWFEPGDEATQLAKILADGGYLSGTLGVEMSNADTFAIGALDAKTFLTLRDAVSPAQLVDISPLMLEVRMLKSPLEIESMRKAGTYTQAGLQAGLEAISAGSSDNDVNAAIYRGLVGAGSEAPSINPIVITGERTGWMPHQAFRRNALQDGDAVYMEVSGVSNRYGAPSMRTGVLGKPSEDVRRLADASIEAVNVLLENIRPGRTGNDIAQVAERTKEAIPEATSGGAFGYSIGLGTIPTWTEAPVYIAKGADRPLEVGMTFHLPNGRWIPGGCGAGFSESIVVTEEGCECLTPNLNMQLTSY